MSASPTDTVADTTAKPAGRGVFSALQWAAAGAVCAVGFWVVPLLVVSSPDELASARRLLKDHTLEASLLFGGAAALVGLIAGVVGGLRSGRERETAALILGLIGVLTGVIGGGLSMPAVVALGPWVHSILSSALAWALAGMIAGLIGYDWSQWPQPSAPLEDDEDESALSPRRVEWLLHQRERRLRDWPLFRVLPVLVVTAALFVSAAALAPSDTALAFGAVGVLGLTAALVLHAQEYRLRHLEARLRDLERRFRGTREEDV